MDALHHIEGEKIKGNVRLVKGSHIIVPKVHSQRHAYILQNPDKRVVFVIPFESQYSLIGTTDVPVKNVQEGAHITDSETDYLLNAANRFLAKKLTREEVVWTYSAVRPLYDDGSADPSKVTRDYVLQVDHADHKAPLVSLFGGKITTYRRLAEHVMERLQPYFPGLKGPWTATETLPGGNVSHFNAYRDEMQNRYSSLGRELVDGLVRRHGNRANNILGEAKSLGDLGRHFGAGLTEREIQYLIAEEWATTAEDILWRRTKCGLHMTPEQRKAVEDVLPA
jgi:glycerol-3-phosphate dehydrogenase